MTAVAEELARLTGLDVPTVSEQVLPHLDSYSAPEPLRLYLESLVGTSPAARSFVLNYLTAKFGPAHHRSTASSQPPSRPASSAGSALASSRPQSSSRNASQSNNNNKGKERQITEEDAMAALNPAERNAVDEIDRGLKLLSLPESHTILQKLKCFCQGRRHPLSNYVRLCRSCGLLLCTLNMPTQPCPSCMTGGPLLTGSALLSHKTAQLNKRESYLSEGKERFALALQVENEERARMSFPSLAERANGMDEVQQRIHRAYGEEDHARRVLTLDLKNKKVSTKKSQPKKQVQAQAGAGGSAAGTAATPADLERELGLDRIQGWIDVRDDGLRKQMDEGKAAPVPPAPAPSIIHYVPRDQDESLEEPEEAEADDDESENAGETEGSTKPSTRANTPADQDPSAQETAADGDGGQGPSSRRSRGQKVKGRSKGPSKGKQTVGAVPGMSAGGPSSNSNGS